MYVDPNCLTMKALKQRVAEGHPVAVFSPGPFPCPQEGEVWVEGPHYPQAHTWWARVRVVNGYVTKVL